MRVKVCGFTRKEDVYAACDAGVHALGFNFAKGPRKISLARGMNLVSACAPFVQSVALFVDADEHTILETMRLCRCQAVQLHGNERPELAAAIRRRFPLYRAFRIRDEVSLRAIGDYPADGYILDAYVPGVEGGTGAVWDYRMLDTVHLQAPVILAGGLNPNNVAAAIADLDIAGVDTASGVEDTPGQKNADLMRNFVDQASR